MGRSAADTPTSPEFLRVSDVDRDRAIDELKQEFVEGRLSHDTFMMRMHAALGARNSGQLSGLLDDLPPRPAGLGRIRAAMRRVAQGSRDMLSIAPGLLPGGAAGSARDDWEDPDDRPAGRVEGWLEHRLERRPSVRFPGPGASAGPPGPPGPPGQARQAAPAVPAGHAAPAGPPVPLAFPRGEGTTYTIGRHRDCDLYIADMSVSRVHAQLERNAGGWLLSDLGSTNGTRLNGWRVRTPVLLQPGDQLKFGNAAFVIQGLPEGPAEGSAEALGEAAPGEAPLA